MRKLVAAVFVSLDGVMQAPGGPTEDPSGGFAFGGWSFPHWDDSMDGFMDVFGEPFDLVLGRRTYDIFAAYWPNHQEHPIGPLFDSVTKYVATSSPESLGWVNSQGLGDDVPAAIARLKQDDGPLLLTQGSSVLLHELARHDLIDEWRLMTFPVLLGPGKRWFDGLAAPGAFTLTRSEASGSGVTLSVYARASGIETGSFAD